ncbi:HlyD family type I secretion periplasmic adaptor subunit [Methylovirgula sp. 4M-Z18]|uniref:HlyD family type I secretion periplasmic adaptor subunit n=1 Tax=Methylovirgula sp. 4M-Z18 TaxID=2293567 RepID=UPI000E2F8BE9|nr:HlyD family type I secretion periplasmic adaptor subunit [Methylovirgula sp. 4M-Z18]RFB81099.1 HlyD family type I secretion periplasmic adaptor subunit [Methylovirgula sp. 4M-Z18]
MERKITPALRSIRRHIFVGMMMVAFVTLGVGGWAATARLSGAVIAQGVVVVDSNVKKIQHVTGGIVGELHVRDGDRVNAGDVLIRLDATQTLATATVVTQNLDELLARQARLEAERDDAEEIVFPGALLEQATDNKSGAAHAMAAERTLFNLRRQAMGGQKAQLKERSVQLQDEINGYLGQVDAKQKEVGLIHQELDGVRVLWQKNLAPITRLNSLERDAARLDGERSQLNGVIAQTKGKISEIELQIIQLDQDRRTEVGKDLIETRSNITEMTERKIAALDQLNHIDIRAPQSGRVHELTVHTVGGVITPGEQIMLIVPDTDTLAVETKIAPPDIGHVHVGQTATMRILAFNRKTTPEVDGEISMVSADLSNDQRTGASYFTVRIPITSEQIEKVGLGKIVPGMPVDVYIKTPARTVLSYLMRPLKDQARRAFKDP